MIEFWRHRGTEDRFTTVWHGIFLEISLPDNLDLLINTKEYHYMLNDLLNETAKDLNMVEFGFSFSILISFELPYLPPRPSQSYLLRTM
jgi:hypothetical protein